MFGAVGGQLPVRLGGTPQNGVTAAQHARLCADWFAVRQTAPLAHFAWVVSGGVATITHYRGMNGSGLAYAPDQVTLDSNTLTFVWSGLLLTDPFGKDYPVRARHFIAGASGSTFRVTTARGMGGNGVSVRQFNDAGTLIAPDDGWAVIW